MAMDDASNARWRPADAKALIGRVLAGKYRLTNVIASRNASAVYAAAHVDLSAPVAVKVLFGPFPPRHLKVDRFLREARICGCVSHPGIVKVLDADMSPDDLRYVVMELLEGDTLAELLTARGRMPVRDSTAIAVEAAMALQAAHDNGYVHSDLQPCNVFVLRESSRIGTGTVKIMGFGLASATRVKADENARSGLRNVFGSDRNAGTMPSIVYGSPAYLSPEQILDEPLRPQSDIYSLGVVLYEMLTGEPVFGRNASPTETMARHLAVKPEPPSSRAPGAGIPAALDEVVLQALAKHPSARFDSAAAFAEALAGTTDSVSENGPAAGPNVARERAHPTRNRSAKRNRLVVSGIIGGGLLLLGFAAVTQTRSPSQAPIATRLVLASAFSLPSAEPSTPTVAASDFPVASVASVDDRPLARRTRPPTILHPPRARPPATTDASTTPRTPASTTSVADYKIDDLKTRYP